MPINKSIEDNSDDNEFIEPNDDNYNEAISNDIVQDDTKANQQGYVTNNEINEPQDKGVQDQDALDQGRSIKPRSTAEPGSAEPGSAEPRSAETRRSTPTSGKQSATDGALWAFNMFNEKRIGTLK